MRGKIIILDPAHNVFEGSLGFFGIKSDGKVNWRTIEAVKVIPNEGKKRKLTLECRSYQPKQLTICIQSNRDSLVTFMFKSLKRTGKYQKENGKQSKQNKRHSSEKSTSWDCSFMLK